jgi:hypothetical protein
LAVLTILTAVGATGAITWAGHLGAKAAWDGVVASSPNGHRS